MNVMELSSCYAENLNCNDSENTIINVEDEKTPKPLFYRSHSLRKNLDGDSRVY